MALDEIGIEIVCSYIADDPDDGLGGWIATATGHGFAAQANSAAPWGAIQAALDGLKAQLHRAGLA